MRMCTQQWIEILEQEGSRFLVTMAYVHVHPARSMNYQLEIFVEDEHEGFYFLYSLGMQIFLDMAVMVDAQGDVLDSIEL